MKIKGFVESYIIAKRLCVISVIAENIPHAHHETILIAYSESRHDSYPQFPRSSLGTRGLQTRSHRQKKNTAFLESRSAKASSTK